MEILEYLSGLSLDVTLSHNIPISIKRGLAGDVNLNDAKIPPFGKGGKGGIFLESPVRNPPRPPLIKGGQKSPAVNSCNNV